MFSMILQFGVQTIQVSQNPMYFHFSFGATRWVEDKPVVDRLLEIWPNMVKITYFWLSLPKSKQPSTKSFENFKTAVNDPLTPVKLNFFSYFASIFQPFLMKYQTDKPMIPYLHSDIVKLSPEYVATCGKTRGYRQVFIW